MKIGVLGAGSWGTTVAHLLARRYDVTLWARDRPIADEINQHQLNSKYLGPSALSPRIFATDDLESAVNKSLDSCCYTRSKFSCSTQAR